MMNKLKSLTVLYTVLAMISTTSNVLSIPDDINTWIDSNQQFKEDLQQIIGFTGFSSDKINPFSFINTIAEKAERIVPQDSKTVQMAMLRVNEIIDTLRLRALKKVADISDIDSFISFVNENTDSASRVDLPLNRLMAAGATTAILKGLIIISWFVALPFATIDRSSLRDNSLFKALVVFIRTTSLGLIIVLSIESIGQIFPVLKVDEPAMTQLINNLMVKGESFKIDNMIDSTANLIRSLLAKDEKISSFDIFDNMATFTPEQNEKLAQLIVYAATVSSASDLVTNNAVVFGTVSLITACLLFTRPANFGVSFGKGTKPLVFQRNLESAAQLFFKLTFTIFIVQFIFRDESLALPALKLSAPVVAAIIMKRESDRITSWVENEDNCSVTTDQEGNKMYLIIPDNEPNSKSAKPNDKS